VLPVIPDGKRACEPDTIVQKINKNKIANRACNSAFSFPIAKRITLVHFTCKIFN
jgi:hypothetical protein